MEQQAEESEIISMDSIIKEASNQEEDEEKYEKIVNEEEVDTEDGNQHEQSIYDDVAESNERKPTDEFSIEEEEYFEPEGAEEVLHAKHLGTDAVNLVEEEEYFIPQGLENEATQAKQPSLANDLTNKLQFQDLEEEEYFAPLENFKENPGKSGINSFHVEEQIQNSGNLANVDSDAKDKNENLLSTDTRNVEIQQKTQSVDPAKRQADLSSNIDEIEEDNNKSTQENGGFYL